VKVEPLGKIDEQLLLELLRLPFRDSGERPRFLRIQRAHVSGVSYLNIGDAGIQLLKDLSETGARVKVRTTLNPGFVELSAAGKRSCDPIVYKKQKEIAECFLKLGVLPTFSCTPHFEGNVPRRGEHLAWAESSAVLYSNSVIGAWTNKESGMGALAAAIMGFTPRTGVHVSEGRKARFQVEYTGEVEDEVVAGALGYLVGKRTGDGISIVKSNGLLKKETTAEYLAALGTSGASPMAIIEGVTPGPRRKTRKSPEKAEMVESEVRELLEEYQTNEPPQAILIGCPHAVFTSERRLLDLAERKPKLPVFVFVSRRRKERLTRAGLTRKLRRRGISVVADACIMWCGLRALGYEAVLTNSVKGAHYLRNHMRIDVGLAPMSELAGGLK